MVLLRAALETLDVSLEALLVDNGSTDGATSSVLKKIQAPWLSVERWTTNVGEVEWLRFGYDWALRDSGTGDFIACCDADGKHNLLDIAHYFHRYLLPGFVDSVVGTIVHPAQTTLMHQADHYNRLFLGALLAETAELPGILYDNPSFQIHRASAVLVAPRIGDYLEHYQQGHGGMPSTGVHGAMVYLMSHSGARVKAVQLGSQGGLGPVSLEHLVTRTQEGLHHLKELKAFMERYKF